MASCAEMIISLLVLLCLASSILTPGIDAENTTSSAHRQCRSLDQWSECNSYRDCLWRPLCLPHQDDSNNCTERLSQEACLEEANLKCRWDPEWTMCRPIPGPCELSMSMAQCVSNPAAKCSWKESCLSTFSPSPSSFGNISSSNTTMETQNDTTSHQSDQVLSTALDPRIKLHLNFGENFSVVDTGLEIQRAFSFDNKVLRNKTLEGYGWKILFRPVVDEAIRFSAQSISHEMAMRVPADSLSQFQGSIMETIASWLRPWQQIDIPFNKEDEEITASSMMIPFCNLQSTSSSANHSAEIDEIIIWSKNCVFHGVVYEIRAQVFAYNESTRSPNSVNTSGILLLQSSTYLYRAPLQGDQIRSAIHEDEAHNKVLIGGFLALLIALAVALFASLASTFHFYRRMNSYKQFAAQEKVRPHNNSIHVEFDLLKSPSQRSPFLNLREFANLSPNQSVCIDNIHGPEPYLHNRRVGGMSIIVGDEIDLMNQIKRHIREFCPNPRLPREIPRDSFHTYELLGAGAFGEVRKGFLQFDSHFPPCLVAVKSVKKTEEHASELELLYEASLMAQFCHPNIVKIVGINRVDEIHILVEFCEYGTLKNCLEEVGEELPMHVKTQMALDIASGMRFISSISLVHRDLAARNILLSTDLKCKIADFGLARFHNEKKRGKEIIEGLQLTSERFPIRWTAPEVLRDIEQFSVFSDVWSFGILMYEIFTNGEKPYKECATNEEVKKYVLESFYRLPCPHFSMCDIDTYNVMKFCWIEEPSERPTFDQLELQLQTLVVACEIDKEDVLMALLDTTNGPACFRKKEASQGPHSIIEADYLGGNTNHRPLSHWITEKLRLDEMRRMNKAMDHNYVALCDSNGSRINSSDALDVNHDDPIIASPWPELSLSSSTSEKFRRNNTDPGSSASTHSRSDDESERTVPIERERQIRKLLSVVRAKNFTSDHAQPPIMEPQLVSKLKRLSLIHGHGSPIRRNAASRRSNNTDTSHSIESSFESNIKRSRGDSLNKEKLLHQVQSKRNELAYLSEQSLTEKQLSPQASKLLLLKALSLTHLFEDSLEGGSQSRISSFGKKTSLEVPVQKEGGSHTLHSGRRNHSDASDEQFTNTSDRRETLFLESSSCTTINNNNSSTKPRNIYADTVFLPMEDTNQIMLGRPSKKLSTVEEVSSTSTHSLPTTPRSSTKGSFDMACSPTTLDSSYKLSCDDNDSTAENHSSIRNPYRNTLPITPEVLDHNIENSNISFKKVNSIIEAPSYHGTPWQPGSSSEIRKHNRDSRHPRESIASIKGTSNAEKKHRIRGLVNGRLVDEMMSVSMESADSLKLGSLSSQTEEV